MDVQPGWGRQDLDRRGFRGGAKAKPWDGQEPAVTEQGPQGGSPSYGSRNRRDRLSNNFLWLELSMSGSH